MSVRYWALLVILTIGLTIVYFFRACSADDEQARPHGPRPLMVGQGRGVRAAVVGTAVYAVAVDVDGKALQVFRSDGVGAPFSSTASVSMETPIRDFQVGSTVDSVAIVLLDAGGQLSLLRVGGAGLEPVGEFSAGAAHRVQLAVLSDQLFLVLVDNKRPLLYNKGGWEEVALGAGSDARAYALHGLPRDRVAVMSWVGRDGAVRAGVFQDGGSLSVPTTLAGSNQGPPENEWPGVTAVDRERIAVVWVRNHYEDNGSSTLVLQQLKGAEAVGSLRELRTDSFGEFLDPKIACKPSGMCLIIWRSRARDVADCLRVGEDGTVDSCPASLSWSASPLRLGDQLVAVVEQKDGLRLVDPTSSPP
jgi:hypothetical protein